jgi:hypothetical protein
MVSLQTPLFVGDVSKSKSGSGSLSGSWLKSFDFDSDSDFDPDRNLTVAPYESVIRTFQSKGTLP